MEKYSKEINILLNEGNLTGDWNNVYEHCMAEAKVAQVLGDLMKLSETDKEDLIRACMLHDWYKRKERELADAAGYSGYENSEHESHRKLLELGVSKRICDIAHSVAPFCFGEIDNYDILRRAMNFIDNICIGSKIVELDERIDALERTEKYKELNESGRAKFNGKTYFQIQRMWGHKIQDELEKLCGVASGQLVTVIKTQLI